MKDERWDEKDMEETGGGRERWRLRQVVVVIGGD